jgi:predicted phage tail protein
VKTVIRLLGDLGQRFGRIYRWAVKSPAEAIRLLEANFPDFRPYLSEAGRQYRVITRHTHRQWDPGDDLGYTELGEGHGQQEILIVPVISGSGDFGKILLGAALLAFAWTGGAAAVFGFGEGGVAAIGSIGASLALSGLSGLLFPAPRAPQLSDNNNQQSFIFNGLGPSNSVRQRIPIVYGRFRIPGLPISGTIDSLTISNSTGTTGGGGGGTGQIVVAS